MKIQTALALAKKAASARVYHSLSRTEYSSEALRAVVVSALLPGAAAGRTQPLQATTRWDPRCLAGRSGIPRSIAADTHEPAFARLPSINSRSLTVRCRGASVIHRLLQPTQLRLIASPASQRVILRGPPFCSSVKTPGSIGPLQWHPQAGTLS